MSVMPSELLSTFLAVSVLLRRLGAAVDTPKTSHCPCISGTLITFRNHLAHRRTATNIYHVTQNEKRRAKKRAHGDKPMTNRYPRNVPSTRNSISLKQSEMFQIHFKHPPSLPPYLQRCWGLDSDRVLHRLDVRVPKQNKLQRGACFGYWLLRTCRTTYTGTDTILPKSDPRTRNK